ncbi:MAG: MBL fold metallo-hydrolase [Chloroflexota bacterium]|nr:MBL fold metallo-hydrolase [Chloroflexota bacterium]
MVIVDRIKSEGIAHNSYLIGSGNYAAVIDPRRDCQVYIDLAQERGLKIRHVFETHRNEDYAVGSIELNHFTAAGIYHGPRNDWGYGTTLSDGQQFEIGALRLTAIHTPGHTDESMSYAVADLSSGEAPVMVFTGDALFVGDVGRTDLYGPGEAPRLATNLHDSIFGRILPLGDGVILYPAHGAGSVCGAHIADRDESTLGIERAQNPWLQLDRDEFIKRKAAQVLERPHYFRQMEKYNLEGPPLLTCLPLPTPLTPAELNEQREQGAILVDTSAPTAFGGAHISCSYSIWLQGLPTYAGWVLPYDQPIVLVLEDQRHLDTAVRYLIRAGYDRIAGYLKGGIEGWYNAGYPAEHLQVLTVHELKAKLDRGEELTILDDRSQKEWDAGHIKGAKHIYVGHIQEMMSEIPTDKPVAVICNVGHRAGLGASVLLREGCHTVYNVLGSMTAWTQAGYPVVKD